MKKIVTFLVIFILVIVVAYQLGLTRLLTDFNQLRNLIQGSGWWGYLIFIALSIFTSVFLLPGQLLAIVGGICWGGFIGGALTVIGATIGCSVSFVIGKYVARDYIVEKMGDSSTFK